MPESSVKVRKRIMYLRDEDGKPRGVMVAVETEENTLRFGMVLYHPKKEHLSFTKKKAKEIAFDRAAKCSYRLPLPKGKYSIIKPGRVHDIQQGWEKAARYFIAEALKRLDIKTFSNVYDPHLTRHTL